MNYLTLGLVLLLTLASLVAFGFSGYRWYVIQVFDLEYLLTGGALAFMAVAASRLRR